METVEVKNDKQKNYIIWGVALLLGILVIAGYFALFAGKSDASTLHSVSQSAIDKRSDKIHDLEKAAKNQWGDLKGSEQDRICKAYNDDDNNIGSTELAELLIGKSIIDDYEHVLALSIVIDDKCDSGDDF